MVKSRDVPETSTCSPADSFYSCQFQDMIFILMGVCGCGKTTVGQKLAEKLETDFRDADEFHSEENKKKMSQGIPLTDQDRLPWLLAIHRYIKELSLNGKSGVVTCSALKHSYRNILTHGRESPTSDITDGSTVDDAIFVHLHGDREVILKRMAARQGHFMPTSLLDSQLSTLESPGSSDNFISVDVANSVDEIVVDILQQVKLV